MCVLSNSERDDDDDHLFPSLVSRFSASIILFLLLFAQKVFSPRGLAPKSTPTSSSHSMALFVLSIYLYFSFGFFFFIFPLILLTRRKHGAQL